MKNQAQKKMIIIIAAIVFVVVIALIVRGSKKQNKPVETGNSNQETKVIEGQKLAEVKTYKGLEISNVSFEIDEKMTTINADVYNPTGKKTEQLWVTINVLDKEGKRVTAIGGIIGALEPGGKTKIDTSILSNGKDKEVYDIELTEQREPMDSGNDNQNNTNNQSQT